MADIDFLPKKDDAKPDYRNVNPWTVIREAATAMGIIVNDPKPNCKKCHGRGYTGRHADTGEPVPCSCIFPPADRKAGDVTFKPRNRAERRKQK